MWKGKSLVCVNVLCQCVVGHSDGNHDTLKLDSLIADIRRGVLQR
jgi:hypothetical protein